MSTDKSKRRPSPHDFLRDAKRIAADTVELTDRLMNHQWSSLGISMCRTASDALCEVMIVKRNYITADWQTVLVRREHLNAALGHYDHLEALTDILRDVLQRLRRKKIAETVARRNRAKAAGREYRNIKVPKLGPTDKQLKRLAEAIDIERAVISKIKENDPKRHRDKLRAKNKDATQAAAADDDIGQESLFKVAQEAGPIP